MPLKAANRHPLIGMALLGVPLLFSIGEPIGTKVLVIGAALLVAMVIDYFDIVVCEVPLPSDKSPK